MDKGVQSWGQLMHSQQHLVPAQRVESVLEVQLHDPVIVIKVASIHRVAWTAASAPPLMPNPSYRGARREVSSSLTLLAAIFATRQRRVQLTAMGRIPPSFLCRAVRLAPKKKGRTVDGFCLPALAAQRKQVQVGGDGGWSELKAYVLEL